MDRTTAIEELQKKKPKVHCLTNPVTMQDVANALLAAGGSAIMARDAKEAEEITQICQATYLNTGVPDMAMLQSCILAGTRAAQLGHPVILDPVGAGASSFRKSIVKELLQNVPVSVIRCNQEEALTLVQLKEGGKRCGSNASGTLVSGGVESLVTFGLVTQQQLAVKLAKLYHCTVLVSGESDVVTDATHSFVLSGGDDRIRRITGSGCMLSALCALFCGTGLLTYEAVCAAGGIWKECSKEAGRRTDRNGGGIGSFRVHLFDALDELCHKGIR